MSDARDPEAEVLVCLAAMQGIPEPEWTGGTVTERGHRLHRLRALSGWCQRTAAQVEESLVGDMDSEIVGLPGVGRLVREEGHASSWADDGANERMRDDLARAVADSLAVNIRTGEIDTGIRQVAMAAMRSAYEVIPSFSNLLVAGRKRYGLQIGDYRTYATTYRVRVEEVE